MTGAPTATLLRPIAALAAALAVAASAVAGPPVPVNVSRSSRDSLTPVVARDGGVVHVAWIESEPTTDGLRATIVSARSLDGGSSFEQPVVVAPLDGYASGLRIAVHTGRVHLAWLVTSYTIGAPAAVAYARSTDGGATFDAAIAVNDGAYPAVPDLAANADWVAVVWASESTVWAISSSDGGTAFSPPFAVSEPGGAVDATARAALDGDTLGVAWIAPRDGARGVVFRSFELGAPGDAQAAVAIGSVSPFVAEARVDAEGGLVALAWNDGGALRLARSSDGGRSFAAVKRLGDAESIAHPRVVVESGVAHVVWLGPRASVSYATLDGDRVASRRFDRRGAFPDVAAAGGTIAISWQAGSGAAVRIRSATSTNAGITFSKARAHTRRTDGGSSARVAAGDGATLVVFEMRAGATRDVFLTRRVE